MIIAKSGSRLTFNQLEVAVLIAAAFSDVPALPQER
jgi:hypothetical protein